MDTEDCRRLTIFTTDKGSIKINNELTFSIKQGQEIPDLLFDVVRFS